MNKKLIAAAALSAAALTTVGAQAESAIPGMYWQDNSISFLYGEDFKSEGDAQQTWTFEHASGWVWGDIFYFLDYVNSRDGEGYFNSTDDGNKSFYYMEFSPRVSMSWLTDSDWSYAPIGLKDTKLAFTYEKGNGGRGGSWETENYLAGVGFDWDVPGMAYFSTNFYSVHTKAKNEYKEHGNTWQITLAGAYPFSVGEQDFVIDGYLDYRGPDDNGTDGNSGSLHSTGSSIQFKWDAGKAMFDAPRKLYVGAELNYWNNKYGSRSDGVAAGNGGFPTGQKDDGVDQQAMQLLVKYHF